MCVCVRVCVCVYGFKVSKVDCITILLQNRICLVSLRIYVTLKLIFTIHSITVEKCSLYYIWNSLLNCETHLKRDEYIATLLPPWNWYGKFDSSIICSEWIVTYKMVSMMMMVMMVVVVVVVVVVDSRSGRYSSRPHSINQLLLYVMASKINVSRYKNIVM